MFTWICPQCGREVPPSYTECPDCAARAKAAPPQPAAPQAPPPQAAPPPPQQPYYQPPPQQAYYPPQQQQYAPPQYPPPPPQYAQQQQQQYAPPPPPTLHYGPPPSRGMHMPVWLLTILFAAGLGGVIFGIYSVMQTNRAQTGNGPAPTAAVESPAAKPGAKANPVQKFIEVSGVRFVQDAKKKTQVRFVLINHSDSDLSNLAGNVTIWGRTKKSEEDAEGSFSFSTNLGPQESKELTVPLNTKLKIYELPDWQNVTTDVQITAPTG